MLVWVLLLFGRRLVGWVLGFVYWSCVFLVCRFGCTCWLFNCRFVLNVCLVVVLL